MGNFCDCYKLNEEEEVPEAKPEPEQEQEHAGTEPEEDIVRTKNTTYNLTARTVGMWRCIIA